MEITNESKAVLYEMYNYYSMQRKCGKPKREAVYFGSACKIRDTLFPESPLSDMEDSLFELKRNGLINGQLGDNSIECCTLTDFAIISIEKLPAGSLLTLSKFLISFIL